MAAYTDANIAQKWPFELVFKIFFKFHSICKFLLCEYDQLTVILHFKFQALTMLYVLENYKAKKS